MLVAPLFTLYWVIATPERLSVAVRESTTGLPALNHQLFPVVPLTVALLTGLVRSILTAVLTVVTFPARSLTVPLTTWLAPWVAFVTPAGHAVASPLVASEQVKLTAVDELFQPYELGAGVRVSVSVGGVSSTLKLIDFWASRLPARSVDQYTTVYLPSENVTGPE